MQFTLPPSSFVMLNGQTIINLVELLLWMHRGKYLDFPIPQLYNLVENVGYFLGNEILGLVILFYIIYNFKNVFLFFSFYLYLGSQFSYSSKPHISNMSQCVYKFLYC